MSQARNPNLPQGDGHLTDVSRGTTSLVVPLDAKLPAVMLAPGISIIPLLQLQSDLEPYDASAEDVEGQCQRAEIATQESYQAGSDILSAISAQLKQLEELRTTTKKPADDYGTMVQKLVNPLKLRFSEAKAQLEKKMLVWRNAEDARQRAAQQVIRDQQVAEANRLAEEARKKGNESTAVRIEEMVAAAPTAPAPRVGHANYTGKTHGKRTYWLGDAQDPMEIVRRVADGKLPIHVLEFSKSGMNAEADKYIKSLPEADQKEQIYFGIKITKSEKLV